MQHATNPHVKRWKPYRPEVGYGHHDQERYQCLPVETQNYFYQVVRYVERRFRDCHLPCVPPLHRGCEAERAGL
jgi:hypothetical protein